MVNENGLEIIAEGQVENVISVNQTKINMKKLVKIIRDGISYDSDTNGSEVEIDVDSIRLTIELQSDICTQKEEKEFRLQETNNFQKCFSHLNILFKTNTKGVLQSESDTSCGLFYLNIQLDKYWESNFMKLENTFK